MKRILALLIAGLLTAVATAQEEFLQPEELLQSVEDWVRENLDEGALDELGVDKERVQQFLAEVRRRFQGSYVFDLNALHETATEMLPILQQFEETRPYAIWLQTHLDYFDVAEELRREVKPDPDKPQPVRLPNPSPQLQRSVWVRELKDRSPPSLADDCVPRLKQIFAAEKLPPELVWVAEVESSFNPSARSPAGAVGLFQLMPATARSLNLALRPRDERLHGEKSARAAARYLRQLHGRFGDWRLALAAFNAGESRVSELLRKHKARTFDAIADRLPAETQMYVPKVEATLRKREGGRTLTELSPPRD
ncbi:MAG TPA: lytic transglycosylase domain-containing protein [Verrucomicrobiae bacterium]|nr:lytic transglycosylase domain-containing protein [Verrucomicrobiae bacterium]